MTIVIERRISMMTVDILSTVRPTRGVENVLKRNATRFATALLAALSNSTSALASAPQIRDQAPGFFRLKVGDLEVTTLYDASAVFQLEWLKGQKATIDGVARALRQDPHLLDAADLGFLVNTGKQLILVDAGAGSWYGGGGVGGLGGGPPRPGRTPGQGGPLPVTDPPPGHLAGPPPHT